MLLEEVANTFLISHNILGENILWQCSRDCQECNTQRAKYKQDVSKIWKVEGFCNSFALAHCALMFILSPFHTFIPFIQSFILCLACALQAQYSNEINEYHEVCVMTGHKRNIIQGVWAFSESGKKEKSKAFMVGPVFLFFFF